MKPTGDSRATINIPRRPAGRRRRCGSSIGYVPGALLASVLKTDVPFQKARFILAKGMREKTQLPITVDHKASVALVQHTFTREERRRGDQGVVVQWKVDVNACNPTCP